MARKKKQNNIIDFFTTPVGVDRKWVYGIVAATIVIGLSFYFWCSYKTTQTIYTHPQTHTIKKLRVDRNVEIKAEQGTAKFNPDGTLDLIDLKNFSLKDLSRLSEFDQADSKPLLPSSILGLE